MDISAIKGGREVRRLDANAIKNFHIFFEDFHKLKVSFLGIGLH